MAEYLAAGRLPTLGDRIPVEGNPASQHLLACKTPLVIADAQTDPRQVPLHDLMRRRGTVSLLLLPLVVDGEVLGSLGVDAIEPRTFSSGEVNLAWRVAGQVSGVLARVRLREERRQLEDQFHQAQKMEAIGWLAGGCPRFQQPADLHSPQHPTAGTPTASPGPVVGARTAHP